MIVDHSHNPLGDREPIFITCVVKMFDTFLGDRL